MALSKAAAHHRARVAALTRDRAPDDPELQEARRSLQAQRLEDRIAELVASAPALTPDQRSRISALLRTGTGVTDEVT